MGNDQSGLRESGVASALAAGCRGDRRDSAADGFQLLVAAGHPDSRRCAAAGGRSGAARSTPTPRAGPADQLHEWAAERAPALGMPVAALEAYAYAASVSPRWRTPTATWPGRRWQASGMVESHHGTYRGARIAPNGDVTPPIRGVPARRHRWATWRSSTAIPAVTSTATRALDRAMGPMQFIPETWRLYGVDANNDGIVSPDNFDDAALSAAGYLCWRGKDLGHAAGLDGRVAGLQPLRPVRAHRAGLGDGLRRRPPALSAPVTGGHALGSCSIDSTRPTQGEASAHHRAGRSPRDPRLPWQPDGRGRGGPRSTARSPEPRCRPAHRPASTRRWSCATAAPATAARACEKAVAGRARRDRARRHRLERRRPAAGRPGAARPRRHAGQVPAGRQRDARRVAGGGQGRGASRPGCRCSATSAGPTRTSCRCR